MMAIANTLDCAIGWAQTVKTEITFDAEAAEMWSIVYEELGDIPAGTIGAILSRAEPHVRRIAMIYAAVDRSLLIRPEHLEAALEVWRYSCASVRWIFDGADSGSVVQDKIQDKILKTIESKPEGVKRSEIGATLSGAVKKSEVEFHLAELLNQGKISKRTEKRSRKSCEYYFRA